MCLSGKKRNIPENLKSLPKVCARNQNKSRKVHLFIFTNSARGSYTLEAAVVLPLVASLWMFALFFFRVLQVESGVQEALYYACEKTAAEAGALADEKALLVSGEVLFRKEASRYPAIGSYVAGGSGGISLLSSELSGEYVRLRAEYRVTFPIGLFSFRGISVVQNGCSRKWTGRGVSGSGEGEESGFLYYTDYGKVYHTTAECSYLKLSIQTADAGLIGYLRNKDGKIYYPCADCGAGGHVTGTVYYTDYGTSYHTTTGCGGLKRSVHMIPRSEAKGMRLCSKCGGG